MSYCLVVKIETRVLDRVVGLVFAVLRLRRNTTGDRNDYSYNAGNEKENDVHKSKI